MTVGNMWIDGEWIAADSGETIEVTNPATGEAVGAVAYGGRAEAARAIDAAHAGFKSWSRLAARERAKCLFALAELVRRNRDGIAAVMSAEMGKPLAEAKWEALGAADNFQWYAEEAKRVNGEMIASTFTNKRIMVIRQPVGVVAAITPWNFPINMAARKLAPALAAGCTVVFKPSMKTPLTAIRLFELIREAGFPQGAANLVLGHAGAFGEEIVGNPKVAKITFTGSTGIGKQLMAGAALQVKRIGMELGGHAPFLVFEDADLDAAVQGLFESKFRNSGQMCISTNRLYVHESVVEPFTEKLIGRLRKTKVGDGRNPGVEIGPLIDEAALRDVLGHIADARSKGANVVYGGQRLTDGDYGKGFFIEPTVLSGVTEAMVVCREETFGPVVPIMTFKDEEEAIAKANDSAYGLAAYAYTQNNSRCFRVAEALDYGIVGINDGAPTQTQAPFGGFKQSGIGREGGHYAIDAFLETKFVSFGL